MLAVRLIPAFWEENAGNWILTLLHRQCMIAEIMGKDIITMPLNCLQHINKQERLSRSSGLLAGPFYNALQGTDRAELYPEGPWLNTFLAWFLRPLLVVMLKGVFNIGRKDRKQINMKVFESKQHILTKKLWYYPGGNTLCRSMSSLFDVGFICTAIILRMEEHMFWPIRSVCVL